MEDAVLFLGKSNQIDDILCFSDLFLLPSEQENFGLCPRTWFTGFRWFALMWRLPEGIEMVFRVFFALLVISMLWQIATHILEDTIDIKSLRRPMSLQKNSIYKVISIMNPFT